MSFQWKNHSGRNQWERFSSRVELKSIEERTVNKKEIMNNYCYMIYKIEQPTNRESDLSFLILQSLNPVEISGDIGVVVLVTYRTSWTSHVYNLFTYLLTYRKVVSWWKCEVFFRINQDRIVV